MRGFWVIVVAALGVSIPTTGSAQEPSQPAAHLSPGSAARTPVDSGVGVPAVAMRLSEEIDARWRSMQQRFREDPQLLRAGALMGLGAATFGALRGQHVLTFVGSHALLLGIDPQLARIRQRSGFALEPSIGYRTLAFRICRTFD